MAPPPPPSLLSFRRLGSPLSCTCLQAGPSTDSTGTLPSGQEERARITKGAIRLGNERAKLMAEKQRLERVKLLRAVKSVLTPCLIPRPHLFVF